MELRQTKATNPVVKKNLYALHCLISFLIICTFWFIPPIEPITALGMKVAGILISLIYLWSTVDTVWPSLAGILLLGISGYAPMNSIITSAFGNPLAILIMYVIILTGAIAEEGLCEYIAQWFVTRKVINGRPWVFSFMLLAGVYILATLTLSTATIFIFWPILYSLFHLLGFKKGDKYATLMIIAVVMTATLSFASTPFKSILPGLLASFSTITGQTIEYLPYMVVGTCISFASILAILALIKYVFKPDIKNLQHIHTDMFSKEPLPKLTKRQIVLVVALAIFMLWMLIPSLLPVGALKSFLNSTQNAVPILCVVLGAIIKIDGTPVINIQKVIGKYMSWSVFLIVASSSTIITALTSDATGITAFLEQVLMPVFEGKSVLTFTILSMLICIVLTNVCNNMVVGMLFIPIIHLFTTQVGMSPIGIGMIVLFVICLAVVTPAGSAIAAILHGNQEWLTPKEIYKYIILMSIVVLIMAFVVGLPLTYIVF
ncbi:MAG: SLC13 family permease [Cellulosilyticaceae bacterium]